MAVPALSTDHIDRPQLYAQLDTAVAIQQRLTLVSAPAGFGKTTLVSNWVRHRPPGPVAWLSLDADDNVPELFVQYLRAALAQALPAVPLPPVVPSWDELTDGTIRHVLTPLVNALTHHAVPLVIVLDDYHVITHPVVHAALTFLVTYLPACVHIVLLSRSDPPFSLANLRAQQRLCELRTNSLRFTPHEVQHVFRAHPSPVVSEQALRAIGRATEGWPVGLQLTRLLMQERPAHLQPSGTHDHIDRDMLFAYIAEEVFAQLTPPVQQFWCAPRSSTSSPMGCAKRSLMMSLVRQPYAM